MFVGRDTRSYQRSCGNRGTYSAQEGAGILLEWGLSTDFPSAVLSSKSSSTSHHQTDQPYNAGTGPLPVEIFTVDKIAVLGTTMTLYSQGVVTRTDLLTQTLSKLEEVIEKNNYRQTITMYQNTNIRTALIITDCIHERFKSNTAVHRDMINGDPAG